MGGLSARLLVKAASGSGNPANNGAKYLRPRNIFQMKQLNPASKLASP